MSFTNDTKGSNSLSKDSPSVAGTLSKPSKTIFLWVSSVFPWVNIVFPWTLNGQGSILTNDAKH